MRPSQCRLRRRACGVAAARTARSRAIVCKQRSSLPVSGLRTTPRAQGRDGRRVHQRIGLRADCTSTRNRLFSDWCAATAAAKARSSNQHPPGRSNYCATITPQPSRRHSFVSNDETPDLWRALQLASLYHITCNITGPAGPAFTPGGTNPHGTSGSSPRGPAARARCGARGTPCA
jgi:hypothetical protein